MSEIEIHIEQEDNSTKTHKRSKSEAPWSRFISAQGSDSFLKKKKDEEEKEKEKEKEHKKGHRRAKSTPDANLISTLIEGKHKYEKEKEKEGLPNQTEEHVLEGYLDVKHHGEGGRKRKWVVLNETSLLIYDKKPSDKKEMKEIKEVKIELISSSLKKRPEKPQHFILVTSFGEYNFKALHIQYLPIWAHAIESVCSNLIHKSIGSRQKDFVDVPSSTPHKTLERKDSITEEKDECRRELRLLACESGNNACADCGKPDPEWVSLNLGIFICIECSGAHRRLGTHISKVRSITYDEIDKSSIQFLRSMGNVAANKFWEYNVGNTKPKESDSIDKKSQWIQWKYSSMAFINQADKEEIIKLFGIQAQNT